MKNDYIISLFTQFFILLSFLLSYKLIGFYYGDMNFEQFSLIKRLVTFVIAIISFGVFTSIVRNVSYYEKDNSLLFVSYSFTILVLCIFIVLISFFEKNIYYSFDLLNIKHEFLYGIFAVLAGMMLHNVLYGYLRGKILYKKANLYDILSKGLAPFFAILISNSLLDFLYLHGAYQISMSLITFSFLNKNIIYKTKDFLYKFNILLSYGSRRIIADISINFIFIVPLFFVNAEDKGTIAFFITIMIVIGYLYTPLNNIILSRMAIYFKDKGIEKNKIVVLYKIIFTSLLFIVLFFIIFKKIILLFFISNINNNLLEISNIYFLSSIFYVIFLINKNIIDAYTKKAINTYILSFSLILFTIVSYLYGYNTYVVSAIYLCMFVIMFVMSSIYTFFIIKDMKDV